jgi:hypothetical protein
MLPIVAQAESMDEAKWRKRVGIDSDVRVFVADERNFYGDIREGLLARGWKEAPFGSTPHWNMMLALKTHAIPHAALKPGQSANHFMGSSAFCKKSGLLKCLEGAQGLIPTSPSRFSPRTYDLDDPHGYQAFVDEFRCVAAESVVREALHWVLSSALEAGLPGLETTLLRRGGDAGSLAPSAASREESLQTLLSQDGSGGVEEAWEKVLSLPALHAFLPSPSAPRLNAAVLAAAVKVTQRRCRDWEAEEEEQQQQQQLALGGEGGEGVHLITEEEWLTLRYCSLRRAGGPSEQASDTLSQERQQRESASVELKQTDKLISQLLEAHDGEAASALLASAVKVGGGGGGSGGGAAGGGESAAATCGAKASIAAAGAAEPAAGGGARRAVLLRRGHSLPPPAPSTTPAATPPKPPGQNLILAQLASWRDKAIRDSPSPVLAAAAAGAFAPSVGDPPLPPPPPQQQQQPLPPLVPLTPALLGTLVALVLRLNAGEEWQTGLNASPSPNVWICKPSGKSRGRGIMCENSLARLLNRHGTEGGGSGGTGLGAGSSVGGGYIAQKYIERPLLIRARKFDIRQWVCVTSWAPLEIWVYGECYARFCSWPFSLGSAVSNKFAHLSNNSIQKHTTAFEASGIEGNMWDSAQLRAWVEERRAGGAWDGMLYTQLEDEGRGLGFDYASGSGSGSSSPRPISACRDVWEEVVMPQVRRIITWTLVSAVDAMCTNPGAASCWEQYGFDIMLDAGLKAWLIEVNSSPDMWYTTPVTERLVKAACDGMVALAVENPVGAALAAAAGAAAAAAEGGASSSAAARRSAAAAAAASLPLTAIPRVGGWECIYRAPHLPTIPGNSVSAAVGMAVTGKALASGAATAGGGGGGGGSGGGGAAAAASAARGGGAPLGLGLGGGAQHVRRPPSAAAAPTPTRAAASAGGGGGAGRQAASLLGSPRPGLPRPPQRARQGGGGGGGVGGENNPRMFLPLKVASVDFAPPTLPPSRSLSAGKF